jgi:hypothetical protein
MTEVGQGSSSQRENQTIAPRSGHIAWLMAMADGKTRPLGFFKNLIGIFELSFSPPASRSYLDPASTYTGVTSVIFRAFLIIRLRLMR